MNEISGSMIRPMPRTSGPGFYASWDASAEVTVVDVAGDHVVILANGDTAWQVAVRQFVDSIRFE